MIAANEGIPEAPYDWRRDAYEKHKHPSVMKVTEKQKTIFVLVLVTLVFINSIVGIIHERVFSWFLLFYSLWIIVYIFLTLKDWNKTE